MRLKLGRLLIALLPLWLLAGCGINNIPSFDEAAEAAWSQVLNQYQRRADLVPNLVETVKGAAEHEKEVFLRVTEARTKVSQLNVSSDMLSDPQAFQRFEAAQGELGSALSRLLVTVEAYPDIKSNQNFLALQTQLEGTENRIAVARRDYIEAVRRYNTELKTFPGRWWRDWLYPESEPKENFSVPDSVTETPQVKFD